MASVYPFIGTRYNTKQAGALDNLLAPPYDCISPKMQDNLYEKDPHNIVRIILGKDVPGDSEYENRYNRAASLLQDWRSEQVLIEDGKQSFYLHEQEFEAPDGNKYRRRGFFGLVRLQGYGSGKVRAHEKTHRGPKADRYRLLRATQFNLSPVFVLYEDPGHEIGGLLSDVMDKTKPNEDAVDNSGIHNRLWAHSNKQTLKAVSEAMRDRELLIADGHHRFETALHYRNEIRRASGQKGGRQPSDYLMMYLVSMSDPGLVILPTHRALAEDLHVGVEVDEVIEDLRENFTVTEHKIDLRKEAEAGAEMLAEEIEKAAKKKKVAFAMVVRGGRAFVLTLKKGVDPTSLYDDDVEVPEAISSLDATVLHNHIIQQVWVGNPEIELGEDEIVYTRDSVEALNMLPKRDACAVFLMNAPTIDQVISVAAAGLRMPQKTTYFYPKIGSGLVMRDMRTIGV